VIPLGRYSLRVVEVLDGDSDDTVLVVEDVSE
jgi:hypothetical protein